MPARLTGLILGGGASSRFGGADKALALVAGVPLVVRVARALSEVPVSEIVVASRDRTQRHVDALAAGPLGARVVGAPFEPGGAPEGPLAGAIAGARVARGAWLALAPCDAPFLASGLYRALAERAAANGRAAAFASSGAGERHAHPLLAVVARAAFLADSEAAWARGERSLKRVIESGPWAPLAGEEARKVDPDLRSLVAVHSMRDLDGL